MSVLMKKGGTARLVLSDFADEDTIVIPAGFKLTGIVVRKGDITAGNISIGTAANGNQVVQVTALSTTIGDLNSLVIQSGYGLYKTNTTLHLTVSSVASGDISFLLQKLV